MRNDLATFYDLSPDLMCGIDHLGVFTSVNPAWQRLLGWSTAELVGKTSLSFIHPEDGDHFGDNIRRAFDNNEVLGCRGRFRTSDGEYRHLVFTGNLGPKGKILFVTAKDVTEQERANQLSRDNEQRVEAILDSLCEGVLVFDRAGDVVRWNHSALEVFECADGREFDHFTKTVEVFDERMNFIPREERAVATSLRTGRTQANLKIALQLKSGILKWFSVTAVPLFRSGDPHPFEVLTTARDITTEHLAQQQLLDVRKHLEERERFLSTMLANIPSLVSYLDLDLRYQYVNHRYEEWHGRPASELLGRSVYEIVGADAYKMIGPKLKTALGGQTVRYTLEINYKCLGLRTMQVSYVPDISKDGVRGIYAVVHDLSPQAEAYRSLRQKDDQIKRVLDLIPAAVSYWDHGQYNVYANACYREFYGQDPEKLRGQHASDSLPDGFYDRFRSRIEGVVRGEPQHFERDLPRLDGSLRQVQTHYVPDIVDGQVVGFLVFNTDISHLKEVEEARRQMEIRLLGASKLSALGEMAAGIAHEINNPLAIILCKASLLREDVERGRAESAHIRDELRAIESVVERIAKVVRSLRKFARDGDREPMFPASVPRLVDDTLELCRERIGNGRVNLRLNFPESLDVVCRGSQISQILLNLLNNSLDAIGAQGDKWIELSGERHGDRAFISVTDSGTPICPEVAARLMEPFFSTKNIGEGSGLGLTVAHRLAQLNGGTLRYDTKSAHTRFVLELPLP